MKNKLIVSVLVFMSAVFGAFASQAPLQGKHVAILPFVVKGEFEPLYAEAAQDKFTTEIIKSNRYVVVGQSQLNKAMRDANFTVGNSDDAMAIKVGELVGAEIVIKATIISLRSQILVNVHAIDVIKGTVVLAESDSAMSYDVLALIEKIARKISGTSGSGKYSIHFSASDIANLPLKEAEKKLIANKLQEKWEIDINDAEQVHSIYKKYLNAGIAVCVVGGVLTLVSVPFMAVGSALSWFFPLNIIFWVSGALMACTCFIIPISAYPFLTAQRIKNIYKKLNGGKSFKFSPAFSSVYDPKEKQERMEIAMKLQF